MSAVQAGYGEEHAATIDLRDRSSQTSSGTVDALEALWTAGGTLFAELAR